MTKIDEIRALLNPAFKCSHPPAEWDSVYECLVCDAQKTEDTHYLLSLLDKRREALREIGDLLFTVDLTDAEGAVAAFKHMERVLRRALDGDAPIAAEEE